MFKTINSKFIVFSVVFILLSVGIPTTFLISQFSANFEQRSIVMLESTLDVVYSCVLNAMHIGRHNDVQKIVKNISRNRAVDHIRIFNTAGIITQASDSSEVGRQIDSISPGHIDFKSLDKENIRLVNPQNIYSITRPIYNTSYCQSCHGSDPIVAYIDVDTDLTQAERYFFTGSTHMIFLAIAIVISLFLGFYLLFNRLINRPLTRFRRALDQVEQGNLDIRLPAQKADEIGILEGHFNTMVANLNNSKKQIDEMHFEQLQRADKLVTLGELAAEMAHEINNPAAIIMSRADFIQMQSLKDKNLDKYEEDLEVIMNQVHKVSNITGSILKYSKKRPKQFLKIELQQIVENAISILEPRIIKKKISIIKHFPEKNSIIAGDAQQIDQVITNLVNNAIDAMEDKGELTISISENNKRQFQLEITDTGHGMDEETKKHIFSPFFTTKTAEKGTGLGLYIVKNILKNHNATIHCESKKGIGTAFTIIFNKEKGNI